MANKALILIDFQNEWINKDSDYYVGDVSEIINKVNKLIVYCRKQGYKIIFTRHVELDSTEAFAEGTKNSEIISELKKDSKDVVITKHKINPFYNTKLDKELDKVDQVVVAGILTNLCVRSFVSDAYDREFDIIVIKDCCVAFDKEIQDFTFKDLKSTREEIEFLNLNEFIKNK